MALVKHITLMDPRNDAFGFLSGAFVGIGSMVKLWPEMSLIQVIPQHAVPQIVIDMPIKIVMTAAVAFVGGLAGVAGKDFYAWLKKRFKK